MSVQTRKQIRWEPGQKMSRTSQFAVTERGRPDLAPRPSGVFMFQPVITVCGVGSAAAIQPYGAWFDGQDVTAIRFKVQILSITPNDTKLVLESSPVPEAIPADWDEIVSWVTKPATDGIEIVAAVSDSGAASSGKQFSRYIRWRVCSPTSNAWEICFRIQAMLGDSFTQWPEFPRVV